MPRKLTQLEWIEKAKIVHNNKYDYNKVEYTGSNNKVIIICPIHGEFEQLARTHLYGQGCPKCGREAAANKLRKSTEEFIEQANKIHNNKYDYSKVEYVHTETKVTIICPEHGEFKQDPHNHLRGKGCPKCGNLNKLKNFTISKGEKQISEWLIKNNISYKNEVRMNIYDIGVRIDFVINNIFIEYNGKQHYEYIPYFHKTKLDFLKQQYRDQCVKNYCKENNITLIEIRYDQNVNEELEKVKDLLI